MRQLEAKKELLADLFRGFGVKHGSLDRGELALAVGIVRNENGADVFGARLFWTLCTGRFLCRAGLHERRRAPAAHGCLPFCHGRPAPAHGRPAAAAYGRALDR